LALKTTETPTRLSQFPILLRQRSVKRRIGKRDVWDYGFEGAERGSGRIMIRDLQPPHQTLIERLQPYKRAGEASLRGRGHPLYLLSEINNPDKHRLIQVVGARPALVILGDRPAGSQTRAQFALSLPRYPKIPIPRVPNWRRKVLKRGAKPYEAPPQMQVYPSIVPQVFFAEGCGAVTGRAVLPILFVIADKVSEIDEGFGPEFA
jgi:hypothetical protein